MSRWSAIARSGPWDADQIVEHLQASRIPLRLACTGTGFPLLASLWFLADEGALWAATRADAEVVRRLTANARCAFEVAADSPPYRGVRGFAEATVLPERGAAVLERLLTRYDQQGTDLARWLLGRAEDEVALRIAPVRWTSWDYANRMQPSSAGR